MGSDQSKPNESTIKTIYSGKKLKVTDDEIHLYLTDDCFVNFNKNKLKQVNEEIYDLFTEDQIDHENSKNNVLRFKKENEREIVMVIEDYDRLDYCRKEIFQSERNSLILDIEISLQENAAQFVDKYIGKIEQIPATINGDEVEVTFFIRDIVNELKNKKDLKEEYSNQVYFIYNSLLAFGVIDDLFNVVVTEDKRFVLELYNPTKLFDFNTCTKREKEEIIKNFGGNDGENSLSPINFEDHFESVKRCYNLELENEQKLKRMKNNVEKLINNF